MKAQECYIRLHGVRKETQTAPFPSIAAAKKWIRECWNRPYTIVKIKKPTA
ncbi:MAG TPA: hypothetical protein PLP63_06660 [Saprospiraceae bacterium]|nr:hypothetical protein [Saprospiraceae bacterium]